MGREGRHLGGCAWTCVAPALNALAHAKNISVALLSCFPAGGEAEEGREVNAACGQGLEEGGELLQRVSVGSGSPDPASPSTSGEQRDAGT